MTKHLKLINILVIMLMLSAFCVAPVAASDAKIITDSPSKEVVVNDFHAKMVNFTLNDKWSDRTLCPILGCCALDERCWKSLPSGMKERFDGLLCGRLGHAELSGHIVIKQHADARRDKIARLQAKLANQGWLDKDVYSSGTLQLSYENNLNNDNKIVVKISFTPKKIFTYNTKFDIYPNDQKEIVLINKTFDLTGVLSADDRDYIELVTKLVDKQSSVDDLGLVIKGGALFVSGGFAVLGCIGAPATFGLTTVLCVGGVGGVVASGGFLMGDVIKNADVKNSVAGYLENLSLREVYHDDGVKEEL
nr:hypothetical protein [uncultured Methanocorpusculum sp.]